ncbi:Uncharacterised protein [Mycobacteroides abscessus subsp. abscessus]|nr:Uncharacterised protein [Mycobacteroides abscessus subsp. abscessus]SHR82279.1 Uncharacterised protein [Mycobacteroides abscessus subsp. abscessus]SHY12843.1 Uncharacterised protein [Mycobacteroides abscessus subsp. abscessus]SLL30924.1 Uncharacterised protein [Mycobacteroides abscessus subsp. abscessus]
MRWTNVMYFAGMALLGVITVSVYPAVMAWLVR